MHQEYLNAFTDKADSDAHILAAWLEGSFGRGAADRYSDIDIHLLVADENKEAFQQRLESWLSDIEPLVLFKDLHGGPSGIRYLSPTKWEADTSPSGNASYACQPDTIIILHFDRNVKSFLQVNLMAVYIPQAKAWEFDGRMLKTHFPDRW